jgi:hypothetical protein
MRKTLAETDRDEERSKQLPLQNSCFMKMGHDYNMRTIKRHGPINAKTLLKNG